MSPAVIGLFGVLLGVLLSGSVKVWQDARNRHERIRDLQTALRAEIRSEISRYEAIDWQKHLQSICQKIKQESKAKNNYTPFVPREPHALVFDLIAKEIHILPEDVIDPVVLYYKQLTTISQFIEDLRADSFSKLDADRKIEMYTDYISLMQYASELAQEAHSALATSLNGDRLSIPASGRSGRKSV